ncbi:MAG: hypothetical protein CVU22_10685 [Betaproteobacteria bacterium HGW-Betaproteobacteria-16]|nr:MAG: hypothetical protein CVU22_10685 [Betaproteobacteria bacterium HGW-Betaproteobacteria-16]
MTLLAMPAIALATEVSNWRISSDIDGFGRNNVKVCLYQTGQGPDALWQAIEPATAGNDCHELVVFDLVSQAIYLSFPGSINNRIYQCSPRVKVSGRHPCNSLFFVGGPSDPDNRSLDQNKLRATLVSSGGMAMATQMITSNAEAARKDCQSRLDAAETVPAVQGVMGECEMILGEAGKAQATGKVSSMEAEALRQAATAKREAESAAMAEYRNLFELATRTREARLLERFISRYTAHDPERLVPKAIEVLVAKRRQNEAAAEEARRIQAAENERRAIELAARERELQKARTLASLERRIATCKTAIAVAGEARAREQAISSSSGYTSPSTLRSAAATEYDCKQTIANSFARYQELGGSKTLGQIN